MNTTFQQELLVFTGSTFSQRELSGKPEPGDEKAGKSMKEQLKEACWNGLLPEMLPEVFQEPVVQRAVFLWDVYEGNSFLALQYGESAMSVEPIHSINPYSYLSVAGQN